ncbi:ankyrin [Polyporus arcularius HHB13444]|uniref:protein S-acyltransferase n=1 Tax=Polyporus arcularius HHB13444 TaxID=1314778 RepID=A0A5C3PNJ1_9APHY|nr:ankyrin [Polyporus arcularius HHB13444]
MMDDFVSSKGEPSVSAVTATSATGSSMTFPQALQTVEEPDVNIFVAAQRGDVETIRSLIESGKASATDRDEQNITPLHWAAINAQVAACRYLLEQGAEVDALGGDLVATPLQWAARNGYLIQHPPPCHTLVIRHGSTVSPPPTDQCRRARLARTHFAHVGGLPGRCTLG